MPPETPSVPSATPPSPTPPVVETPPAAPAVLVVDAEPETPGPEVPLEAPAEPAAPTDPPINLASDPNADANTEGPQYDGYRRLTLRQHILPRDDFWPAILFIRRILIWILIATIIWRFWSNIQAGIIGLAQLFIHKFFPPPSG